MVERETGSLPFLRPAESPSKLVSYSSQSVSLFLRVFRRVRYEKLKLESDHIVWRNSSQMCRDLVDCRVATSSPSTFMRWQ